MSALLTAYWLRTMAPFELNLEGDRLAFIGWGWFIALGGLAWFIADTNDLQPAEGFTLWLLFVGLEGLGLGLSMQRGQLNSALMLWLGGLCTLVSLALLVSLRGWISVESGSALAIMAFGLMILVWAVIRPPAKTKENGSDKGEK